MTQSPQGSDFDDMFGGDDEQPTRRSRRDGGRKKKGGAGKKFLAGILVLALIAGLGIAGYVWYIGNLWNSGSEQLSQEDVFGGEQPKPSGKGVNILLLGSDSRDEDVDYFGDARGNRSDTIMVAHIPADNSGVQVISIPRDTWVDIEGHGKAKINAAMSYGGLPLATKTIGNFIGAPIHHVAILDFEGFTKLTDAVGGVDVYSEHSFTINGHSYTEGINHLTGEEALPFVRARKNFADGDLQRMRNQQAYLKALMDKIVSRDTLSDPTKVTAMVRDFSPYMSVDDALSASKIAAMAFDLRNVRTDDIQFFSAPISGAGRSSDGQAILNIDEGELEKIRDAFENDTVDEYAATAKPVHL